MCNKRTRGYQMCNKRTQGYQMCNKRTQGYQMCNKRTRGYQMCNKRTRGYQMQMMTDEESQPLRSFGAGSSCNRCTKGMKSKLKKKNALDLGCHTTGKWQQRDEKAN
ncbi:hypothetical protein CAPTEDRAFT_198481 [Capitella teleta]|uniref:Uncharacterized protein n=1 Tax=Capitella teleta TaxID=283909 RepID=R7UMP6_CAPTE|nr:hypothetical protein CAPTEDRAFT_198481 [Capitella teleta]|eukprot:ELU07373.1 hypothetical protein CAPTEDRAFT_198481 [Capitella teleta]